MRTAPGPWLVLFPLSHKPHQVGTVGILAGHSTRQGWLRQCWDAPRPGCSGMEVAWNPHNKIYGVTPLHTDTIVTIRSPPAQTRTHARSQPHKASGTQQAGPQQDALANPSVGHTRPPRFHQTREICKKGRKVHLLPLQPRGLLLRGSHTGQHSVPDDCPDGAGCP